MPHLVLGAQSALLCKEEAHLSPGDKILSSGRGRQAGAGEGAGSYWWLPPPQQPQHCPPPPTLCVA